MTRGRPALLLGCLLVAMLAGGLLAGLAVVTRTGHAGGAAPPDAAGHHVRQPVARDGDGSANGDGRASGERVALAVLRGWDRRRAAAYAGGSPGRLRELYVPGAPAGVADIRVLRAYRHRGLRVVGMRMQVLAVTVLGASGDRLRLRVTDRLAAAVAVGAGRRRALPRDQATTRELTLLRDAEGRWQMSAVGVPA